MVIFIVFNVLAVLALYNGYKYLVVKKVIILFRNFVFELNGFIIVYFLDLYIGLIVGKIMFERVVRIINQLNVDVIVVIGDLVDVIVY